jgi:hypothetical protein
MACWWEISDIGAPVSQSTVHVLLLISGILLDHKPDLHLAWLVSLKADCWYLVILSPPSSSLSGGWSEQFPGIHMRTLRLFSRPSGGASIIQHGRPFRCTVR